MSGTTSPCDPIFAIFEPSNSNSIDSVELGNGAIYEGFISEDGCLEGNESKVTWPDGTIYRGMFQRNRPNGVGNYKWQDGTEYSGEIKNGLRDGFGTFLASGCSISGDWKEGRLHGRAKLTLTRPGEEGEYDGEWVDCQRTGHGILRYASGNIYEGSFVECIKHGKGKMIWKTMNGQSYEGEWKNGKPEGTGVYKWPLAGASMLRPTFGLHSYDGEWKEGKRHGKGAFYYADGSVYIGDWINNRKEGEGVFLGFNGQILAGKWSHDRYLGKDIRQHDTFFFYLNFPVVLSDLNMLIKMNQEFLIGIFKNHSKELDGFRVFTRFDIWNLLSSFGLFEKGVSTFQIDETFASGFSSHPIYCNRQKDMHNPNTRLSFSDFLHYLIIIADVIYSISSTTEKLGLNGSAASLGLLISQDLSKDKRCFESAINQNDFELFQAKEDAFSSAKKVFEKLKQAFPDISTQRMLDIITTKCFHVAKNGEFNPSAIVSMFEYAMLHATCALERKDVEE